MTGEETFLWALAEDLRRMGLMGPEPEEDEEEDNLWGVFPDVMEDGNED